MSRPDCDRFVTASGWRRMCGLCRKREKKMMHCQSRIQNMVVLLNETVWSKKLHSDVCHELLHVLSGRMSIECADG